MTARQSQVCISPVGSSEKLIATVVADVIREEGMSGYIEQIDIQPFRKKVRNLQNLVAGSNGPNGPYRSAKPSPPEVPRGSPLILIVGDEGDTAVEGGGPTVGDIDRVNGAYPLPLMFANCVVDPSDSWYRGA